LISTVISIASGVAALIIGLSLRSLLGRALGAA
jgi:hypothetical protein